MASYPVNIISTQTNGQSVTSNAGISNPQSQVPLSYYTPAHSHLLYKSNVLSQTTNGTLLPAGQFVSAAPGLSAALPQPQQLQSQHQIGQSSMYPTASVPIQNQYSAGINLPSYNGQRVQYISASGGKV
jgi:hypothetical protein